MKTEKLYKELPGLKEYLEDYGLDQSIIDRIDRYRINFNSGYVLLGYKSYPDGAPNDPDFPADLISMLDLSNTPDEMMNQSKGTNHNWNMLNDGMEDIREKDWKKIQLDDYCETFTIDGHETYGE